jgi:DNA primase
MQRQLDNLNVESKRETNRDVTYKAETVLEDKKLRDIILLKVNEEDFLSNASKEILNYIIKNQELDKITIDKIKSLNIAEEYLKDLESISLDNINLANVKGIDEIVKNVKKNSLNEKINRLLEEQKEIEKYKNTNDAKEVDIKIMEIALKIVELRRNLQNL